MSEQNNYFYQFGAFRLDVQRRLLLRDGEVVSLKPKAFDTLLVLIQADGQVVGKDELMRRIWPDTTVEEGNLTFNISTLRKALGDDPRRHEYIVTIPGEGYQFVASVSVEEEEPPPLDAGAKQLVDGNVPARSRLPLALLSLAVVALAGLGIYWLIFRRAEDTNLLFREISISRISTSGKVKHAAISPDGKYVAQVTADARGDSLFVSQVTSPQNILIAGPSDTEFVSVTFAPDGNAIYYLTLDRNKGHTALYRVPSLGGAASLTATDVGPIGFSPDGKQIAFVKNDRAETRLVIANVDATSERTLATLKQPQFFRLDWNAPSWSPDGKTIACQARLSDERGHFETVVGFRVGDGNRVSLTSQRWAYVTQPVWLGDGSGLLVTASVSETAPNQVWQIETPSGKTTRVTHDLNSYSDLSLTADSSRMMAVQDQNVASVWTQAAGKVSPAREIFSEVGLVDDLAWTTDGRILYRSDASGSAEIWVMNADGSSPKQLTVDARASRGICVSPDGRYVFFASDRAGRFNIWRVDLDGRNLKQLTNGEAELYPQVTADSQTVVFQQGEVEPRLFKVSVEGGPTVQVTDTRAFRPAISPKGDLIAYHYLDPDVDSSRWRLGVVAVTGGPRVKQFDLPAIIPNSRLIRWTPDGEPAFADGARGLAEIWLQPLNGTPARRLTDLKAEQILGFDWSRDGRTLAVVRKVQTSDTVLISNSASNR